MFWRTASSIASRVASGTSAPSVAERPMMLTAPSAPIAEISVMGAEGAVNIIGRSATEGADVPEATREAMLDAVRQNIDPYIAAGNAMIDDVIDPRETRPTIVKALRMARTKNVTKPAKRHGVMPV